MVVVDHCCDSDTCFMKLHFVLIKTRIWNMKHCSVRNISCCNYAKSHNHRQVVYRSGFKRFLLAPLKQYLPQIRAQQCIRFCAAAGANQNMGALVLNSWIQDKSHKLATKANKQASKQDSRQASKGTNKGMKEQANERKNARASEQTNKHRLCGLMHKSTNAK